MPHWNMFADEVWAEQRYLRESGRDPGNLPMRDSYKAQALRELARRRNLEQTYQELQQHYAEAIDRLETAEYDLDILRTGGRVREDRP